MCRTIKLKHLCHIATVANITNIELAKWDLSPEKGKLEGISDWAVRVIVQSYKYLTNIGNFATFNSCFQFFLHPEIIRSRQTSDTPLFKTCTIFMIFHSCDWNHVCVGISDMTAGWRKKHAPNKQSNDEPQSLTFISLKPRLIRLLLEALQCESDSFNVQILLGGL